MKEKPVFISATDGNHGYGLAYAAKLLGCDCIIYMPVVIIFCIFLSLHTCLEMEKLCIKRSVY